MADEGEEGGDLRASYDAANGPQRVAVSRRYSGLAEASGRKAANVVEAAPPPLERPWWMKVHGDGPPVTNLEEIMDQFLTDPDMRTLEKVCEKSVAKTDVRNVHSIVPGIDQEDADSLLRWQQQVTKFLKYRGLVFEKHERKGGMKGGRGSRNRFDSVESNLSESEESTTDSMSETSSIRTPRTRRANSGRGSSMRQRRSDPGDGPPAAGRRRPSRADSSGGGKTPMSGSRRPSNAGLPGTMSPRRPSNAGVGSPGAMLPRRKPSNADSVASVRAAAASPGMSPRTTRRPSNADSVLAFRSAADTPVRASSRLAKAGSSVITPTGSEAPTPTLNKRLSRRSSRFSSSN